jgi:alpha,alpha-trehalose phosphorylase
VETARLWRSLGFFSEREDGRFCIHGVTGPDEYTTVVNNNTFTNLMARENLWYAAEVVSRLHEEDPETFSSLVDRTALELAEVQAWKEAADRMYLPYDERRGVHPQDDAFLDREPWDFDGTPPEKYPLLLNYHPLVIYRHQVIKQADMVLAMLLLGHEFSLEEKRRNFEYYDPLTTGDSSLSVCIQSIVACEVGDLEKAREYAEYALMMDLGDIHGNVEDGLHIASMGGTWMVVAYGLAGMRDHAGRISFRPRTLGPRLSRLRFPLTIRDRMLEVDISRQSVTYRLLEGDELCFRHFDEEIRLKKAEPAVKRDLSQGTTT